MSEFTISPWQGDAPMKPWPSLADKAFCLKYCSGESIFYYNAIPIDLPPQGSHPVFVLVHGLGDEADSWRHIIPLLCNQGCQVLAPDLPGFGRSIAQGKISMKSHAIAVIKFIEAVLKPQNPVYLVGSSMGAMVTEMVILLKPELISGIILVSGSIPGGPANPGFLAVAKMLLSRKWYKAYRDAPKDLWATLYPYYADLDSLPQEDRDFLKERVMERVESSSQERAFFATQSSIVRAYIFSVSRISRKIRRFPGKILLVWGEKDRIIPLSSTKAFTALRSDIKLEVIPGAGHLPQQEKPEALVHLIVDFIRK